MRLRGERLDRQGRAGQRVAVPHDPDQLLLKERAAVEALPRPAEGADGDIHAAGIQRLGNAAFLMPQDQLRMGSQCAEGSDEARRQHGR